MAHKSQMRDGSGINKMPTVFVVDDNSAVCDAIRGMVEEIGLRVKTYGTANQFLDDLDPYDCGCLVLDVRMPGMSGLDLQKYMIERGVTLPIIVITGYGDVPMAVRSMKLGAFEFLQKPFNDQDLIDYICVAIDRHKKVLIDLVLSAKARKRFSTLTRREREVLGLLVKGMSSKQVADGLNISVRTVEGHRTSIMRKTRVHSVAQLIESYYRAE